MRFAWFNLMPWPDLPDDFREQNRSVWVDIDSALYDPERGHAVYHECIDQLEYADSLGFDGIGVNEHRGRGDHPLPGLRPQRVGCTPVTWPGQRHGPPTGRCPPRSGGDMARSTPGAPPTGRSRATTRVRR